jgi:hypothetical protein
MEILRFAQNDITGGARFFNGLLDPKSASRIGFLAMVGLLRTPTQLPGNLTFACCHLNSPVYERRRKDNPLFGSVNPGYLEGPAIFLRRFSTSFYRVNEGNRYINVSIYYH